MTFQFFLITLLETCLPPHTMHLHQRFESWNRQIKRLSIFWTIIFYSTSQYWISRGRSGGGGSLGSNEPPFLLIHSTYWFFVIWPAVFDTQRWRASPVWLLYNLHAIQFNMHAVK